MQTIREYIEDFRLQSPDQFIKGRRFEDLVVLVLENFSEYEIERVYHWEDWPEREAVTNLDGRDIGIDLVAKHRSGYWIAIQCKCYDGRRKVTKKDIDSFLAVSQRQCFAQRWLVTTSDWTDNASRQIREMTTPVKRIDLLKHGHQLVPLAGEPPQPRQLNDRQRQAVKRSVRKLQRNDRGRLIMACGTGKTFTSLRIAERLVPDSGCILFVVPSIALVSQSRREWLQHSRRPLRSIAVCSDKSAGGRKEDPVSTSELVCEVTTKPHRIAQILTKGTTTKVVFSTYHSIDRIITAQSDYGAPAFDLVICDEAHRTTGVDKQKLPGGNSGFQNVHDDQLLRANKRLYMTATPRIYTQSSKKSLKTRGLDLIDMSDEGIYGPLLDLLSFKEAVNLGLLSDYRVIVAGVHQGIVPIGLRHRLVRLADDESAQSGRRPLIVTDVDLQRVIATSLAINGLVEGDQIEAPRQLYRSIVFANSIARSKYYARALDNPQLKSLITRRKTKGQALKTEAQHLDASDNSYRRFRALNDLHQASNDNVARLLCNVGLFSEGVDVPSLDAVVFMEPRSSQIDVVQAVGRVMRRSEKKHLGYVIVPIPIEPGKNLIESLEAENAGYNIIGQVLRALQSHDERLLEEPDSFIKVREFGLSAPQISSTDREEQTVLDITTKDLDKAGDSLYSVLVAKSGLGRPHQLVTERIAAQVNTTARILMDGRAEAVLTSDLVGDLASVLGITVDDNEKDICKIASLLVVNACLLHRRLQSVPIWDDQLTAMIDISGGGGARTSCGSRGS